MPRPYFSSPSVTLYHGDALDILPELPKASADLIVTDPPYGVRWQSHRRKAPFSMMAGDNGELDVVDVLGWAIRALRPFRHVYVFGPADLSRLPIGGSTALVWDKMNIGSGDLSSPWGPAHEAIQFGVFAPSKANRDRGDGVSAARLRKGSVLRIPRLNSGNVKLHPTEKPVALLRILIESSSTFDEVVLDPFAGSGSTLEAAATEGRKAIGIEINEAYCEVIARRIQAIQ